MKKGNSGFTLIELMIVITVIAILAGMVLFGLGQAQKRARDVQRLQILKSVQNALTSYYGDKGSYPTTTVWGDAAATDLFNAAVLGTYVTAMYDPGCGKGANTFDVRDGNNPPLASTGCPATLVYSYTTAAVAGSGCPTGNAYTLSVVKEGGGVAYLCSPQ